MGDQEEPEEGICAKPLLQIISATINASKDTLNESVELYGKIFVRANNEDDHLLYEREERESESVYFGSSLKLIGLNCVIPACVGMYIEAELNVKDACDSELYTSKRLEVDVEDHYDRLMTTKLNGNGYEVELKYFVLHCALPASLSVEFKNSGSSTKPFNGGELLACYEDTCERYEEGFKYPEIVLYNFIRQPMGPQSESHFELDCDCVAVPAYSSLIIKFVSREGEEKSHTFKPFENGFIGHTSFSIGDISLEVTVTWTDLAREKHISTRQLPLKNNFLFDDDDKRDPCREPVSLPRHVWFRSKLKAEVFSIFIGGKSHQAVSLYGTVKVYTRGGDYYLFKRDVNDPEVLKASEKMLRLVGPPRAIADFPASLHVDLKDAQSSLSIKGCSFLYERNEYPQLDKRLLYVYQGNYGYAALHYMMIAQAFGVRIKVYTVGQDITDATKHVRGSIYAEYGIHSYDTEYDIAFNRSCLFKDDDCARELTVKEGKCKIPLRKNRVVVNYRSSLILDIDVRIGTNEVLFMEKIEFKPPGRLVRIRCQDKSLVIRVTWDFPPGLLKRLSKERFSWMGSDVSVVRREDHGHGWKVRFSDGE